MKKLFVSILALSAFVACQSGFDGVDVNITPSQSGTNYGGTHTIYAEVGVGGETKATYGDDLKATWEENDQIALLQEHADYGKTFSVVNKLNIKEGWGTSYASFNGDISVDATSPRVYHIAYPANAVSFNTTSSLTKTSESAYAYREDGLEVGHYYATASFKYTYNANLNITIPTEQNGKWEPYMYASTSESVSSNGIGAKTFTTLTGAIAIRAFEADGTTPKQLSSITITSSDVALAGAFTGTATSEASLGSITGEETSGVYSTVSEDDVLFGTWKGAKFGREEAENLLLAKVQGMEPTSTSVTKAMSLSFAGNEKSITATNLENVAVDTEGYYTYYLNVAPATVGTLTIIANATDGTTLVKNIDNQTFRASARKGYNLKWESAKFTCGSIETWYDNYSTDPSFNLQANTLYANNLKVEGVPADQVLALGVVVNGTLYGAQSGVLEVAQVKAEGLASGNYNAYAYAKVLVNGEEKEFTAKIGNYNVTSIPTVNATVRTSYSSNGSVSKSNSIDGKELQLTASLSDSSFPSNLVASCQAVYGSTTANIALGSTSKFSVAVGEYNCYAKVTLANGYVATSTAYTTYVTGIPYSFQFYQSSNDVVDAAGWTRNGAASIKMELLTLKEGGLAGSDSGWVSSPAYYIPSSLSVSVTLQSKYYVATVSASSKKAILYVGATSSPTSSSDSAQSIQLSGTNDTSSDSKWTSNTVTVSMPAGKQYTSVNHNGATYTMGSRIYVATYSIKY